MWRAVISVLDEMAQLSAAAPVLNLDVLAEGFVEGRKISNTWIDDNRLGCVRQKRKIHDVVAVCDVNRCRIASIAKQDKFLRTVAVLIEYESSHEPAAGAADDGDTIPQFRSQDGPHQLKRRAGDNDDVIAAMSIHLKSVHAPRS